MKIYLGSLRTWHWVSSAICLVGMLLFAITGITLNHADQIKAVPKVSTINAQVPESVLKTIEVPEQESAPLPESLEQWLEKEQGIIVAGRNAEWTEDDLYVALPRPGGDAWLSIDFASGALEYEVTERGWISFFNDLHKARHTGTAWRWFIDAFAVVCIIFCITGLVLLHRYSRNRPTTWPLVALGLVLPWVLILLFIH